MRSDQHLDWFYWLQRFGPSKGLLLFDAYDFEEAFARDLDEDKLGLREKSLVDLGPNPSDLGVFNT